MFFGIPGMCFKISTGVVWWLFVCLFLEFYWTDWAIYVQKNWNLFSVNVAMATTGIYQLSRKIRLDFCFYLGLIFIKKFLYSVHYSSSCPACSLFVHQAPKSSLLQWKDIHKSLCCCCVISAGIKPKSLYCSEGSSRSCEVFLGSKVADEFWRAILWPIQFSFSLLSSSAQFFVFSKYHLGLHLTHVPSYVHVDFNVVFRCPSWFSRAETVLEALKEMHLIRVLGQCRQDYMSVPEAPLNKVWMGVARITYTYCLCVCYWFQFPNS